MKHVMQNINTTNLEFEDNNSINNIDDDIWYLTDEITEKYLVINWAKYSIDIHHQTLVKEFIKAITNSTHQQSGHIYCRSSTLMGHLRILKTLIACVCKLFPNQLLSDLRLQDIKKIAHLAILKKGNGKYGRGAADDFVKSSRYLYKYYSKGLIVDGINCDLPKFLHEYLYRELFSNDKEYLTWKKGQGWNTLPAEIAILFLSDMLEIIKNSPTEFLFEYFKFQRSKQAINLTRNSRQGNKNLTILKEALRVSEKLPKNPHSKYYELDKNVRSNLSNLAKIYIKAGYSSVSMPTAGNIADMSKKTQEAAVIIFTILSGARISEIASVRGNSFSKDRNGNHFFTSNIIKTHQGVKVKRSISGEAKKMVEICMKLSYVDKTNISPFISKYGGVHAPPNYGNNYVNNFKLLPGSLSQQIGLIYKNWISLQSDVIKDKAPKKISPHFFRHAFADIALRRFDGRVSESIRRHFAHAYGSSYTQAYTDDKLNEDIQAAAEKAYLIEIIGEIAEGNKDFYGPVAKRIRTLIKEDHRFLSLKEFDDAVKDLAIEYESIIPHEWGYCVLNPKELAKAQCKDKNTGDLKVWENSSIKNCTHCVHRLTHKSQAENLVRIGISHQNFIEKSPLKSITGISKQVLKQIRVALKEMNVELNNERI